MLIDSLFGSRFLVIFVGRVTAGLIPFWATPLHIVALAAIRVGKEEEGEHDRSQSIVFLVILSAKNLLIAHHCPSRR